MPPKKIKRAAKPAADPNTQDGPAEGQNVTQQQDNTVDVVMGEAGQEDDKQEEFVFGDEDLVVNKIRALPGETDTSASFEFTNEDHTLGNALRYVIMKNPDVEFCGYSIPHPSDPKMNLRIQTYEDVDPPVSPRAVLEKGLDDLMELCDVVLDKFEEEKERFAREGRRKGVAGSG